MKAVWKDQVIAESNETIIVENNHYFPPESVNKKFISLSDTHTTCPWKGEASYYKLEVNNDVNKDAAWFYPYPKQAAENIKDYVAFWKDVQIIP